jgi:hypothetical protein
LVCTGLVALARSRPTAFLKITLSGVRECPLGVVSLRWEPAFDKSLTREPRRPAALRVRNQVCSTDQELRDNYLQFRLIFRQFDSVARHREQKCELLWPDLPSRRLLTWTGSKD